MAAPPTRRIATVKSPQRRQSRGVASRRRGPVARTAWCRRTDGSAERLSQTRKKGKQMTPVTPVMPMKRRRTSRS